MNAISLLTRYLPSRIITASALCLATLSPVMGEVIYMEGARYDSGKTYVNDDVRVTGQYMDCATDDDEPELTLYKGAKLTLNTGKFRNVAIPNLKDWYFGSHNNSDQANDYFNSATNEAGSWEICEDSNYQGECQILNLPGDFPGSTLGSLPGKISSIRPVGCSDKKSANIRMNTTELRKPQNSRTETAECLDDSDSGIIANNGKVKLVWAQGILGLKDAASNKTLWKTPTPMQQGKLCFDSYANLAIYAGSSSTPVWETGKVEANSNAELVLRDTCELTITVGMENIWSSGNSCN